MRLSASLGLAVVGVVLCVAPAVLAQDTGGSALDSPSPPPVYGRTLPKQFLEKPSQPPAFTLPVQSLGFSAPGSFYLGKRESFVSLDFIDENRLLFTFRVPGLLHREAGEEGGRQIRAVVLALPAGTVEAEALWTVHDRVRYLWMLKDGHFLLRDRDNLDLSDGTLELKPYLRFPGPLLYVETDPAQKFLVTNSSEPVAKPKEPGEASSPIIHPVDKDQSSRPSGIDSSPEAMTAQPDLIVRILRRDSGQVMLVSRTNNAVHLPINADGYLESLRSKGDKWLLNMKYFSGGSSILGQVDSACSLALDFVAQREVLVSTCTASGESKLVAIGIDGRHLWSYMPFRQTVWPLLVRSPDSSRVAWEAMVVTDPISARSPLYQEDVKGQLVEVLNAADGKVALDAPASPALDAGGNVAISPSGRRVAVLNSGQIQVFELPLPAAVTSLPVR